MVGCIRRFVSRKISKLRRSVAKRLLRISEKIAARKIFEYDKKRFLQYSGAYSNSTEHAMRAHIIRIYHIVEKGLTMPNR